MAITGGIKFFKKNYLDIDFESALLSASSGSDTRNNLRDRRRHTRWESSGSDDDTTETITGIFDASYEIDRLILKKHNFKAFTVQYWDGSAWQDFSSVVTAEGTQTTITETACTKSTSYYEFTAVTTSKIRLQVTSTQTADAEKFLYELVATKEIGTLQGYPRYQGRFGRTQIEKKSIRGRSKFTLLDEQYMASLSFSNYPTEADHTLVLSLWEGLDEFLIYPCGAKASQFQFSSMIGNRLEDLFLVAIAGDLEPGYTDNVYALGLNYSVSMKEVV